MPPKDDRKHLKAEARRNNGSSQHCLHPLKKGEARVTCMQDYEAFKDKKSSGIPAVQDIATLKVTDHDKHPITAEGFM